MLFIPGRILFAMLVASVAPVAARRPLDVVNRGPILCSPNVCSQMALYGLPIRK